MIINLNNKLNIFACKKGFSLTEVLTGIALIGMLSVAFITIFVTGINVLNNSVELTQGTEKAGGDIENWYAGNEEGTAAAANQQTVAFPGVAFTEDGTLVTGSDNDTDVLLKSFIPERQIANPYNQAIVCKSNLAINKSIYSSQQIIINARTFNLSQSQTVVASAGSKLYSDTASLFGFSGFTFSGGYKELYLPFPTAPQNTYVDYSGANISFNVTNANLFYYVDNFNITQSGTITVINDRTDNTNRCLFIYIKSSFNIHTAKQLTISNTGTGSAHTGVYFIYCNTEPANLHGDLSNGVLQPSIGIYSSTAGCYIYAPNSQINIIGNDLSGIIGDKIDIYGSSNFSLNPVNISNNCPTWTELINMLSGS